MHVQSDPEKQRRSKIVTVTRPALARVLGISLRQVGALEAQGAIVPTRRGKGGRPSLYALQEVVPAYIARLTDAPTSVSDRAARTRRDNATARLTELRISREEGSLVSRDEVVFAGQNYTKGWMAMVRALPRRARQSGIVTTPEQEAALESLCREILTEIAAWRALPDVERSIRKADAA